MTMFEQFREFVAGKPREERYDFDNTLNCAIAQFGKHMYGTEFESAGGSYFTIDDDEMVSVDNGTQKVGHICATSYTFGELYDKLALLEDHS